jgi:hypothetical protein
MIVAQNNDQINNNILVLAITNVYKGLPLFSKDNIRRQ